MYTVSIKGDILELHSQSLSFNGTEHEYWYYDIVNWLRTVHGKKDEVPTMQMTESDIDWVKKHYIPKLKSNN